MSQTIQFERTIPAPKPVPITLITAVLLAAVIAVPVYAAGPAMNTPLPRPQAVTVPAKPAANKTAPRPWYQVGKASWYGPHFQGHTTANGEIYNMNLFTCAHRNLPLGSWIKVTNLRNQKSIVVRVNDRGPMVEGRIVDLSFAAAQALNISGLGKVSLELVKADDPEPYMEEISQMQAPPLIPKLVP
jgi:rare lipoprotein A